MNDRERRILPLMIQRRDSLDADITIQAQRLKYAESRSDPVYNPVTIAARLQELQEERSAVQARISKIENPQGENDRWLD